jgi:hypothetical protein
VFTVFGQLDFLTSGKKNLTVTNLGEGNKDDEISKGYFFHQGVSASQQEGVHEPNLLIYRF